MALQHDCGGTGYVERQSFQYPSLGSWPCNQAQVSIYTPDAKAFSILASDRGPATGEAGAGEPFTQASFSILASDRGPATAPGSSGDGPALHPFSILASDRGPATGPASVSGALRHPALSVS